MSLEWAITLIVLIGIVAAILGYEYGRYEHIIYGDKEREKQQDGE